MYRSSASAGEGFGFRVLGLKVLGFRSCCKHDGEDVIMLMRLSMPMITPIIITMVGGHLHYRQTAIVNIIAIIQTAL